MLTERGARNTAVQARLIAVSTHSSNVKPRFLETADFATGLGVVDLLALKSERAPVVSTDGR
jgi:hypothetical protein